MQTRLLRGTNELARVFRKWSRKAKDIRIVTAWATVDCAVCDSLKEARIKLSTMVVGLDFHSTSPRFLKDFWLIVRIGEAAGRWTFHPKLYLFKDGGQSCCIIGSSNFTSGGFNGNTELNICIEGNRSDPLFHQISKFVDEQERQSQPISSAIFDDYQARFKELRNERQRLAKFRVSRKAKTKAKEKNVRENAGQEPPEQLNKTWSEFARLMLAPGQRERVVKNKLGEPSYLQTAERCQRSFARYGRLSKMPLRDRQFIGGTTRDAGAGWFGSMIGNGYFKQRLNGNPTSLDAALGRIPLKGVVNRRQFDAFAARYGGVGAGVGTGSRLLAMKRPDLFICIDSKNRAGVALAVGVPAQSLRTFEGYWELMQRIWSCPWWKEPRPSEPLHRRLWNARVALLDLLYYVE